VIGKQAAAVHSRKAQRRPAQARPDIVDIISLRFGSPMRGGSLRDHAPARNGTQRGLNNLQPGLWVEIYSRIHAK
jgi:hypothetical protein